MNGWCIVAAAALTLCGCLTEADWDEHNFEVPPTTDGAVPDRTCGGVTCAKGHCSDGTCVCETGYAGARCDRCASGYSGYPSCKKNPTCECSKGQTKCASATTIKVCPDGCTWTTTSCSSVCGPKKGSPGCASSLAEGKDVCWCATQGFGIWILRLKVLSSCAGKKVSLMVRDLTAKSSYATVSVPVNKPSEYAYECRPGHKLCFGAWLPGGDYWGCGEGCKQACTGCCASCTSGIISKQMGLDCT